MAPRNSQAGFSLMELIVVVVLLGLLAGGAGMLIVNPIEAYDDQVRRQRLVDQGEMALRQIARDVRRALPNSVRVIGVGSGAAVELVPTIDGARYRDEIGGEFTTADDTLEFGGPDTRFNLLGFLNTFSAPATLTGLRLVIYNTTSTPTAGIYADAAADLNSGIVTSSTTMLNLDDEMPITEVEHRITMTPAFRFTQQSPGQRVFVIDEPVSYVCNPLTGSIVRHSGYGFNAAQPAAPGGSDVATVASQLSGCNMSYSGGTSQRGGILTIGITIADGGEAINLLHQVHVVNVP